MPTLEVGESYLFHGLTNTKKERGAYILMKAKLALPPAFAVGAVWFSTHCGGGFASGRQEVQYFVQFGWNAIWIPVVSMALLGLAFYQAWEFARINKTYDYRSFVNKLFYPYDKIFANLFEIGYNLLMVMAVGAALAGAASLVQTTLSVSYGVGVLISGFILAIFCIFGSKLVRDASTIMSVFLIGSLIIVTFLGIKMGAPNLSSIISAKTQTGSLGKAIWQGIIYAGFQSWLISAVISISEPLQTRSDVFKAALNGVLINGGMLLLVCLMLLGFYPAVIKETLPVYYVVGKLGVPRLYSLYSLILFFAFISTGVTMLFASVRRFENIWTKGTGIFASVHVRRTVIAVLFMAICLGISLFGLTAIVAKGYGTLGYFALVLVIIPCIFVAGYKNRKARGEQVIKALTPQNVES